MLRTWNDKISIIVPVYNVENYLVQCLDSIINQSYKNLEIIVIDDWSTDNSWKICDEYAKKDKRIKLIHQENLDLSAARNAWLRISTGKYIGYVDSDDYIELDMYERLYNQLIATKADLAICNRYIGDKDWKRAKNTKFPDKEIITSDEALQCFYKSMYVWNKLYKRSLVKDVTFVETRAQDVIYNFTIFKRARRIVCLNEYKNYYRYSSNSRSHVKKFRKNRLIFIEDGLNQEIQYSEDKKLYLLKKWLIEDKVKYSVYWLSLLALENSPDEDSINFLRKILKKYLLIYLKNKNSIMRKCFSIVVCINFQLASAIYKLIVNGKTYLNTKFSRVDC